MGAVQIAVAIIMLAVTVFVFMWFQSSQAAASAKRRIAMMKRAGLDPGTTTLFGPRAAVLRKEVRRRCQGCPREDLCDKWLAGEVEGGNAFCPNARVFHAAAEIRRLQGCAGSAGFEIRCQAHPAIPGGPPLYSGRLSANFEPLIEVKKHE